MEAPDRKIIIQPFVTSRIRLTGCDYAPKEPSSRYSVNGMFFNNEEDLYAYLNKKSILIKAIEFIIRMLDLPFLLPTKTINILDPKIKPKPQPKPNK